MVSFSCDIFSLDDFLQQFDQLHKVCEEYLKELNECRKKEQKEPLQVISVD